MITSLLPISTLFPYTTLFRSAAKFATPDRVEDLLMGERASGRGEERRENLPLDRKSTRLNSSHVENSYAVFCLKKKKSIFRISLQATRQPRILQISSFRSYIS